VLIGLMGGREAQLDLAKLLGKRVQLIGSTLRNRDDAFKGELIDELRRQVWPLFAEKRLDPRLEHSFAAKDVGAAFEMLASNTVSGKVALVIDDSLV
jgi:NADPH:quinone reductase-like Zn-dependent oxidoreductase